MSYNSGEIHHLQTCGVSSGTFAILKAKLVQ